MGHGDMQEFNSPSLASIAARDLAFFMQIPKGTHEGGQGLSNFHCVSFLRISLNSVRRLLVGVLSIIRDDVGASGLMQRILVMGVVSRHELFAYLFYILAPLCQRVDTIYNECVFSITLTSTPL